MSSAVAPEASPAPVLPLRWRARTLPALIVAALALPILFQEETRAAIGIWITSTAFGHCFLVVPIAIYLAWERRDAAVAVLRAGAGPSPLLWPVLALLPLAIVWLAAERLGIMEGRQLAALAMLEVLAYALLGPALWRTMAVPLLYLVFLVPFGAFLTPALQSFTARFIDLGLGVLGIPHVVTNNVIDIPAGSFRVAEACAGLRFLIASIAFGVLYACTIYRSPLRRIAFVAASIVVPIIANGLRALGIVVLGQVLGSPQAASIDHLIYGWVFFSAVTIVLILAGLPFRQDRHPPLPARPVRPAPSHATAAGLVAACGIALMALGPATAAWLGHAAGAGSPIRPAIMLPPGCTVAPPKDPDTQSVVCDGTLIHVRAERFSARSSPQTLVSAQRALAGPGEIVSAVALSDAASRPWQLVRTTEPARLYVIGAWATEDGSPPSGLGWRTRQAWASLHRQAASAWRPTFIAAWVPTPDVSAPAILGRFVSAQR